MRCRVAAAQVALGKESYTKAVEDAKSLIRAASRSGAQIVCLPEHWLLEHWSQAGDLQDRLADAARTWRVYVVTGANYVKADGGNRVRSMLIDPDGRLVGWQDKVHLFLNERNSAVAGSEYVLHATALGKIGITICYDNVFPEAARTLALRGADLILVPSRITAEGLEPWLLYLKTRVLENRIPMIAPNVFHPPRYPGGSVIIEPRPSKSSPVVLPEIVASADTGEVAIVADIDLDLARELRLKRLSERIPQAYG